MASNLRVDTILPSTGLTLGIGTASGTINFLGNSNIVTTGNVSIGGTLTYEDVTNVDSVGVITARDGLRVTGVTTITGTGEYLLQLNKSDSSAVYTQFTNSTSGTSTSDGFRIGMDSNEDGLVWLREDGNVKFGTDNSERLRIGGNGEIGIGGANYGTSGQVLTSQGSGSAVQWATPSSGSMTLLATMTTNMSANTQSQSLTLTGYQKLMGTITGLQRSGGLNDVWFGFNNMTSSGNYSWYRSYLDNSNDTSAQHSANGTGYAYGSVGPGFFYNLAGVAGFDSGNNDGEFTLHNLQDGGRKIFTMTVRGYLTRNIVINTSGSVEQTAAITSFQVNVAQSSHRLTGGTIKLYGFK